MEKNIYLNRLSKLLTVREAEIVMRNSDFNLRRDLQKKILWASRLWVGRRKELILGYVQKKNDEKNNSGWKGLKKMRIYKFV